jgi:hypothetical protein
MAPITNVYETEAGKRLIAYLQSLGIDAEKVNLDVWGHKRLVQVQDPDSFHQVAQLTNNREISKFGGLHFIVDVEGECGLPDHWTISLMDEGTEDFLNKHKGEYKIV